MKREIGDLSFSAFARERFLSVNESRSSLVASGAEKRSAAANREKLNDSTNQSRLVGGRIILSYQYLWLSSVRTTCRHLGQPDAQ